ncbi:MAG: TetR/AcrR family transcriptional regulator [Bauldia sp.]|nr:TetR/AcrR family transcriptional regulator [Bauldia sp.]
MARATRGTAKRGASTRKPPPAPRDRMIDALMALLADRPFAAITLADIAAEAGVSLADLREAFGGKAAILAAFVRRIDLAVLGGGEPDMSLGPRDRLFEAEMRRFDALAPYKPALVSLTRSARRDPALACLLHGFATRSQKWTLAAAGIHRGGLAGCATVEGAVLIHLEALRTWLRDDDEDLARTMAALDRGLRRGERAIRILDQVCAFAPRLAERGRRMRDSGRTARASRGDA